MFKPDPYSTHLPALARAIHKLGGPVLELGAGLYSTPLIRALCDDGCTTIDTDPQWAAQFTHICSKDNPVVIINPDRIMDELTPYLQRDWSVVLMDLATAEQRVTFTPLLRHVQCIVAHDTENVYWNPVISTFRYTRRWEHYTPHTSYLSDVYDVRTL